MALVFARGESGPREGPHHVSSLGPAERSGPSEDDRILVRGPLFFVRRQDLRTNRSAPSNHARDATQAGLSRRGDLREGPPVMVMPQTPHRMEQIAAQAAGDLVR